jgi:PAS domain S-box-containing protein
MKTIRTGSESKTPAVVLRRRAEKIARGKAFRIPENMESLSVEAARQMLHELRVHQIELEMQNEELRRAHAELDAARARYFDLYDLAPVGYFTLSDQGLILEANLMAASLLGVAKDALVKQPLPRFILPEDQDIYYLHCKQLFETGAPQMCEIQMVRKDTTVFRVRLEATAAQDADGRRVCRAVMSDITERKQAEEELRVSEELFRSYLENAPDGVYLSDLKGNFLYGNHKCEEIIGYRREELIGKNFLELNILPEKSLNKAAQLLQANMEGKSTGPDEIELISKEGRLIPVEINTSVVQHMGQGIVLAFVRDITERKQAEKVLRESETRFREMFDDAPIGYHELDSEGRITRINRTELATLGYSAEEMLGRHVWEFIYEKDLSRKAVLDKLAGTLPQGQNLERTYCKKDGTRIPVLIQDLLLWDKDGKITGIRTTVQDITDRKQADEKLKDTFESLRKAVSTTIQVMVSAVETRDPYTAGHQARSTELACAIATEIGLPQEKIDGIRMAGSIHDIGKLSIPAEILSKPTDLSKLEFSLIKEHSRSGYEILKDVESPWPLAQIVYQHHERMDGSGYPRNLKGDDILMEARILAVSDVVESMASHRPYRAALGLHVALEEIEKNRGTLYDEAVGDTCLRLFREKGYRFAER